MPEKTKETPLHDVVLKIMFEKNKEKPAQLFPNEIFWSITDAAVTEYNIKEVLNWLASHERVEKVSGKYSLDRHEFLDQRKLDRAESSQEVISSSKKGDSKTGKEEIPLHDVILNLMFKASDEKPAELTVNDVYWMTSDPSVLEVQVGDVLKWLLHHHRVEYRDGKYSLDRFEFLDQTKAAETLEAVKPKAKQPSKEQKKPKALTKVKPKVVIPPAPKEPVVTKKQTKPKPAEEKKKPITPKEKVAVKVPKPVKTPEPKKEVPVAKPVETKVVADVPKAVEPIQVQEATSDNRKLHTALLFIAACLFIYSCYLLLSASASSTAESSNKAQGEIISAKSELKELSETQTNAPVQLEAIERRLVLVEEITVKNFEQQNVQNQNIASNMSVIVRLLISNSLILLIFGFLLYHGIGKDKSKRD